MNTFTFIVYLTTYNGITGELTEKTIGSVKINPCFITPAKVMEAIKAITTGFIPYCNINEDWKGEDLSSESLYSFSFYDVDGKERLRVVEDH